MGLFDRLRKRPSGPAPTTTPSFGASDLPSDLGHSFLDTPSMQRYRSGQPAPEPPALPPAPLRGQRWLLALVGLGVALLVLAVLSGVAATARQAERLAALGQAQMQTQRLAKAAALSVDGAVAAYGELKDSAASMAQQLRLLQGAPGASLADLWGLADAGLAESLAPAAAAWARLDKQVQALLAQQAAALRAQESARVAARSAAELVLLAEAAGVSHLQAGGAAAEVSALGQVLALAQRAARSAAAAGSGETALKQAVAELAELRSIVQRLGEADAARPARKRDTALADRLAALKSKSEQLAGELASVTEGAGTLAAAAETRRAVVSESEGMRQGLQALAAQLAGTGGFTTLHLALIAAGVVLALAGCAGLLRLFVQEQLARARVAEAQRLHAEREQQQARLLNDANQSAILRLMDELQAVAEGDLTRQATVTEDVTGAIADSINLTVEELRNLVAQVQQAAGRVAGTTEAVEHTSGELLAASSEQLREIRETGEAVLQMAGRLNEVSAQAQRMAAVARQSLGAAAGGLTAVQNAIGGVHAIREQIQDSSRRIKRLGESSQEIGEITELIADLTDQTNLLALNAAIQAASAGEAGRGFAVVAQEVQRLAERSAEATRQIAALVQTIQTDTQDAVAAMEVSTAGVVEGSKLSDAAGTALDEIDRVTHQLSNLVERISAQAQQEASSVNQVAANIQHIFSVTEQTAEGTQSTVERVRELTRLAEELRTSVARFKIS